MGIKDIRRVHEIESSVSDFTKSEDVSMIALLQEEREKAREKLAESERSRTQLIKQNSALVAENERLELERSNLKTTVEDIEDDILMLTTRLAESAKHVHDLESMIKASQEPQKYKRADELFCGDIIIYQGVKVFIDSIELVDGYVRVNKSQTLTPPESQIEMV